MDIHEALFAYRESFLFLFTEYLSAECLNDAKRLYLWESSSIFGLSVVCVGTLKSGHTYDFSKTVLITASGLQC